MPLDIAIYVASASAIFGTRGGFLHKFNPTTGRLISKKRFSPIPGAQSALAYCSVDGTLWCGSSHSIARTSGSIAAEWAIGNYIYRMSTADALTAIGSINLTTFHSTVFAADGLYNLVESGATGSDLMYGLFCTQNPQHSYIAKFDPTTHLLAGWHEDSGDPTPSYRDIITVGSRLWVSTQAYQDLQELDPSRPSGTWDSFTTNWLMPYPVNGCCYNPSSSLFYGGLCNRFINAQSILTGVVTAIDCGVAGSIVYRVRRDPVTGRIFTANGPSDSVSWFLPGGTVYYQTGYDFPLDIVFTGSKIWAVQAGSVPLREIDITTPTGPP